MNDYTVVPFAAGAPNAGRYGYNKEDGQAPTACIANIGPRERRQRLRFGVVSLSLGVLLGVALIALQADPWSRLALFLPFTGGAVGYFQARDKT